jgi:exopolysaccharide biosynthesis polyprenyl glycosylphosphotransferase
MPKRFGVNYAIMTILLDYGLTVLALIIAVALRPILPRIPFLVPLQSVRLPTLFYLGIPLLWIIVFLIASVYDPKRNHRVVDEILSVTVATGLATMVFAGVLYLLYRDFSRWLFVVFVLLDLFFLLGWRILARYIIRVIDWPAHERRVLVVGAGEVGKQVETMLDQNHWEGFTFFGYMDDDEKKVNVQANVLGKITDTKAVVAEKNISDVVIALPQRANGRINDLIVDLHELPVQIRVVPDYFSLALHRATIDDFGGLPLISLRDPALSNVELTIKRLFDMVIGGILTVIAFPLMALTAMAMKLDSPGPIFFKQQRVGENGRLFTMYKFRSMFDGAEDLQHKMIETSENGEIVFKRKDDPRITRVGHFMRRTSLDELPQLFNVLKGDMSLVGPRPELPDLVDFYEQWQRKRFAVPQGITGWWQINGRSDRPMHLHTTDDLFYIQNYSVWLDLYILFKTVLVVFRGTGAY